MQRECLHLWQDAGEGAVDGLRCTGRRCWACRPCGRVGGSRAWPQGDRSRSGGGAEPRRSGLLVARRSLFRRQSRAAAHGHQGQSPARPPGLDGLVRNSIVPRTTGRDCGPMPISISLPARSAAGCIRSACAGSPSSAGPSAVAALRMGMAILFRASTSPGAPARAVIEPFVRLAREAESRGLVRFRFRHRVDELVTTDGAVTGARGSVLKADPVGRGQRSSRDVAGDFEISAGAVIVTSGGIGGNHELVRRNWPRKRLGQPPATMVCGVPHHVDGRMLEIAEPRPRVGHQLRSHVALHRGPEELRSDLAGPRHPHPARSVVLLVRCRRQSLLPRRPCPASIRSAPCRPSATAATTTAGSS